MGCGLRHGSCALLTNKCSTSPGQLVTGEEAGEGGYAGRMALQVWCGPRFSPHA